LRDYNMAKNPTVKEHFIPQVYLRGFSPGYEIYRKDLVDKSKFTIYYFDLFENKQQKAVPIKSQCYEKNIYEVKNSEGNIINQNLIENALGNVENLFSNYRDELERKVFIEENFKTPCFLTKEEKTFWVTFIAIQLLRTPTILNVAQDITKDTFGDLITDNEARGLARMYCLPFYKEIEENSIEARFLDKIMSPFFKMHFHVFVNKNDNFITSDKTMYVYSPETPCEEYERVVFPITSSICLILLGGKEKKDWAGKNCLHPSNSEVEEMVFKDIAGSAYGKLFSNHILNAKELKMLKDVEEIKLRG